MGPSLDQSAIRYGCGRELEQHRLQGFSALWIPANCAECTSVAEAAHVAKEKAEAEAAAARRLREAIDASGLPPLIIESLPGIAPIGRSLEMRNTVDRFLRREIKQPWLFITGSKGTGKSTEAGRALLKHLENGRDGAFVKFGDLLLRIRDSFGKHDGQSELKILTRYRDADLLVLDDLGQHRSSPYAADVLFALLDDRYGNARHTIITSNYSMQGLAQQIATNDDEITAGRIVDRIRELSFWFAIERSSYRADAATAERDFSWADERIPTPRPPVV